jgi:arabinogalactan endo-1,4-beta-galactosidase
VLSFQDFLDVFSLSSYVFFLYTLCVLELYLFIFKDISFTYQKKKMFVAVKHIYDTPMECYTNGDSNELYSIWRTMDDGACCKV